MENMEDVEVYLNAVEPLGIKKTVLLGSPEVTLYQRGGFDEYDKNNAELLEIKEAYPGKFEVLCTTYWHDPLQVEKAQECYEKGAKGIKLYNGHGSFYELPLDDPTMLPLYEFIEDNGLILLFHVNSNKYLDEFERVLDAYPDMKVICPHFCLISKKLKTLTRLMDEHPNLYTDLSFGFIEYTVAGFNRFTNNHSDFKKFITKYRNRVFLGTDQVITNVKTQAHPEFVDLLMQTHMRILGDEEFDFEVSWPQEHSTTFRGLDLDEETLDWVLRKGPAEILKSVPGA
jgi:predicted TIM-barrel fold metal-dependent hydrolase